MILIFAILGIFGSAFGSQRTFHIAYIRDPENPELYKVFTDKIERLNQETKEFQLFPVPTDQTSGTLSSLGVQKQVCRSINKNNVTVVIGPLNSEHVAETSNMLSILGIPNIVPTRTGRFGGALWSTYQITLGAQPPKAPFLALLKLYDWNKVTVVYSKDHYGMSEMIGILKAISQDNTVIVVEEIPVPGNDFGNEDEWADVQLR